LILEWKIIPEGWNLPASAIPELNVSRQARHLLTGPPRKGTIYRKALHQSLR